MRGLPPVPANVCHLEADIACNDSTFSTSFWFLDAVGALVDTTVLGDMITSFFNFVMPPMLELMHNGCIFTTCRARIGGIYTEEGAPPNVGAWSGGQANNCASGLRWLFQGVGRRSWSMSYIPGLPDVFVSDGWRINELGYGNLLESGEEMILQLNRIGNGTSGAIPVGTLQRQHLGRPLPSSAFAPYDSVIPISKVVTIRRRIPSRGALSPAP